MPRPISWLPQLKIIRRSVSNSVRSHYERGDLEVLFKVQSSTANKLLDILPTVRIGSSLLVEREALQAFLDRVAETDDVHGLLAEMRAAKNVSSRKKLRRLTRYDLEPVGMTALPEWIRMEPGRLEVRFTTAEQLGEAMLMVAGILEHELEEFVARYEPAAANPEKEIQAKRDLQALFADLRQREADFTSLRPS
jgi:hypothetical protein